MKIQYTSFSETGLIRKENQDALFCGTDHGAGLFVVADGMGGCQDGGRASTIIKEKAAHWWSRYKHSVKPPDFLTAVRELQEVFAEANGTIYSGTESGASCGSTLVLIPQDSLPLPLAFKVPSAKGADPSTGITSIFFKSYF